MGKAAKVAEGAGVEEDDGSEEPQDDVDGEPSVADDVEGEDDEGGDSGGGDAGYGEEMKEHLENAERTEVVGEGDEDSEVEEEGE